MLKIIKTMAMVVLASILIGMPMTQVMSQPENLSRSRIVSSLRAAFSTILTASGENILLDEEKALFLSKFEGSLAFVPLHPTYWLKAQELFEAMAQGQEVTVPVGGLYVVEPIKVESYENFEFGLDQGPYLLRWAKDKVLVIDQEGNVLGAIKAELKFPNRQLSDPIVKTEQVGRATLIRIDTPWIGPILETDSGNGYIHTNTLLGDRAAIAGFAAGIVVGLLIVLLF